MKKIKKILSILLVVLTITTNIPFFAEEKAGDEFTNHTRTGNQENESTEVVLNEEIDQQITEWEETKLAEAQEKISSQQEGNADLLQSKANTIVSQQKISEIFPDKRIAELIGSQLGKNPSEMVTQVELDTITRLYITEYSFEDKIESIQGMNYLRRLSWLDFGVKQQIDLSPISNLPITNIAFNYINGQNYTPIKTLRRLESLSITGGENASPSKLDFVNPITIKSLYLAEMDNLDLNSLKAFKNVNIFSLNQGGVKNFDFLNNFNLTYLSLNINGKADLSAIGKQKNLEALTILPFQSRYGKPTTDLHLDTSFLRTLKLKHLTFGSAKLLQKVYGVNYQDINKVTSLESLILTSSQNPMNSLKVIGNLTNLTYLSITDNTLFDVTHIKNLKNLQHVSLGNNNLLNFSGLDGIDSVHVYERITLPNTNVYQATNLMFKGIPSFNGATPQIEFRGKGEYQNGKLTWFTQGTHHMDYTLENDYAPSYPSKRIFISVQQKASMTPKFVERGGMKYYLNSNGTVGFADEIKDGKVTRKFDFYDETYLNAEVLKNIRYEYSLDSEGSLTGAFLRDQTTGKNIKIFNFYPNTKFNQAHWQNTQYEYSLDSEGSLTGAFLKQQGTNKTIKIYSFYPNTKYDGNRWLNAQYEYSLDVNGYLTGAALRKKGTLTNECIYAFYPNTKYDGNRWLHTSYEYYLDKEGYLEYALRRNDNSMVRTHKYIFNPKTKYDGNRWNNVKETIVL